MKKINIKSTFLIFDDITELSIEDNSLYLKAKEARDNAYAPYSNFHVGVALLLKNGKVILGNNQENAAYPSGMCAERVALWNASSQYPKIPILKLFITAKSNIKKVNKPVSPCGACRQSIAEYEGNQNDAIEIFFMGETGKVIKSDSLKNLLPLSFDKDLL
ncbi:MAG: cytidine deaminase [Flavobacteriaceae bacterium]